MLFVVFLDVLSCGAEIFWGAFGRSCDICTHAIKRQLIHMFTTMCVRVCCLACCRLDARLCVFAHENRNTTEYVLSCVC